MRKFKWINILIIVGVLCTSVSVFAAEEEIEYKGCKIVREENGCYLLQDDDGDTEWVCEESGISTYQDKCTLDCWNY